jgi:hypothetical protein
MYFIVFLHKSGSNIEVVNAPLDYNLLLGHSWFYAMIVVTYLMFRIL